MKLYQLNNNKYEMVNSEKRLVYIHLIGKRYVTQVCGKVSDRWQSTGTLLKEIPNHIKTVVFKANKKINNSSQTIQNK